jgi:hypothetical protein
MVPNWLPVIGASAVLVAAAMYVARIRDQYDAERWEIDPDYCRYGASWTEVFKWWRNRK